LELPEKILNTVSQFSKLPGVGEKTALRQSLILTGWETQDLKNFGQAIEDLVNLKNCLRCGMFAEVEYCDICSTESRNELGFLCVVENISDCLAIERSDQFKGIYHVLGGVLNPLLGIGPDELKIDHVVQRIKNEKISNVVLAINPSVEGDATCSFIKDQLPSTINVERIGFGIPMGGSLEYLDNLTISKALENRKKI
jgi:recombination protein RecR